MESIKEKANSLFATVFPNIKCEEPYIDSQTLYIPFTWDLLSKGLMVFDQGMLDAFRCRPLSFEGIDWIKMKYLTKEPAIYEMEAFLRDTWSK